MFSIILIIVCGVVAGFGLRRWRKLQYINHTISFTIWCMLFVLGVSVGQNRSIVNNLWSYGAQALLISVASMLGSAIGAWLLYKFVLNNKSHKS